MVVELNATLVAPTAGAVTPGRVVTDIVAEFGAMEIVMRLSVGCAYKLEVPLVENVRANNGFVEDALAFPAHLHDRVPLGISDGHHGQAAHANQRHVGECSACLDLR